MPVRSYFSKRDDRKLTMPRADEGTSDATGVVLHGEVLTGKLSVPEAFGQVSARASQALSPGTRVGPEDYDPVLKFHLRIE
jgi:hypothetical protein